VTDPTQDETARLAPLRFLEGEWQGEGRGPFGPYRLAARVERRGRWLLMTSEIFDAKSDQVTYVSTQVYGYDEQGLRLSFFDTAGSFDFRGTQAADGLRFDWRDGENWKRSQYWPEANGKVRFRYESGYPKQSSEVFEGSWSHNSSDRSI
jgi:hypothetical protein